MHSPSPKTTPDAPLKALEQANAENARLRGELARIQGAAFAVVQAADGPHRQDAVNVLAGLLPTEPPTAPQPIGLPDPPPDPKPPSK